MAVGDPYYQIYSSGSWTATDDDIHKLFGSFSGLSLLGASEVLHIEIGASGADLMLLPTDAASKVQDGIRFQEDSASYVPLKPMRVSDASQLHFRNQTAGDNAVARWVIWIRKG